jgi:hypothetical protein
MYKQNLSVMGVASCRSAFLCLMSRVCLVPSRISVRDPFSGHACPGFRSAMWPQPGPVRPSPALAPLPSPCARPLPPPNPFVSFDFLPRSNLPLPLPPLSISPHGALEFGVEIAGIWILGGEFSPSPSLSLSLCSPSPSSSPRGLPVRAPRCPWPRAHAALGPAPVPPSAPRPRRPLALHRRHPSTLRPARRRRPRPVPPTRPRARPR